MILDIDIVSESIIFNLNLVLHLLQADNPTLLLHLCEGKAMFACFCTLYLVVTPLDSVWFTEKCNHSIELFCEHKAPRAIRET